MQLPQALSPSQLVDSYCCVICSPSCTGMNVNMQNGPFFVILYAFICKCNMDFDNNNNL